MKSIAKAILAGGFILAAQAAVADAFPPETHDTGPNITFQSTYADRHANDPVRSAGSAFPAPSHDTGPNMDYQSTYADRHANDPVRSAGLAFPPADHDTGPNITFQSTYADSHLDRPALASQPAQGADATAD